MASGLKLNPENNHFTARYEHPWGGVAADAAPMDIMPNQQVQADGVVVKNGVFCAASFNQYNNINFSTVAAQGFFHGILIQRVIVVNHRILALDNTGHSYIYNGTVFVLDQTLVGGPIFTNISCLQVISGVLYIFDFPNGEMYVYTPGVSYVVGQTFVAGLYCCVLDQYLLTANTNQPTDSPAVKANRYNWSSPDGFTSWNPATDRTSGFNTLADVQDAITGIFAMGNVGYVLRDQGVTQLTPNGIGIGPFDTTSLWASQFGVGCTYPATFAQYGLVAAWFNDNNIYSFTSGSYPAEIGGSAKNAIYSDLNFNENNTAANVMISASISNSGVNTTTPELYYTLAIVTLLNSTSLIGIFWVYNFKEKTWTRQVIDLFALLNVISGNAFPNGVGIRSAQVFGLLTSSSFVSAPVSKRVVTSLLLTVVDASSGIGGSFVLGQYINNGVSATVPTLAPQMALTFKQEEFELGRQPSVRGVAVKASGSGTLNVLVNGVPFTPIVAAGGLTTYYSSGTLTGEDVQLGIAATNFDGTIIKAYMVGSYAEGEIL